MKSPHFQLPYTIEVVASTMNFFDQIFQNSWPQSLILHSFFDWVLIYIKRLLHLYGQLAVNLLAQGLLTF